MKTSRVSWYSRIERSLRRAALWRRKLFILGSLHLSSVERGRGIEVISFQWNKKSFQSYSADKSNDYVTRWRISTLERRRFWKFISRFFSSPLGYVTNFSQNYRKVLQSLPTLKSEIKSNFSQAIWTFSQHSEQKKIHLAEAISVELLPNKKKNKLLLRKKTKQHKSFDRSYARKNIFIQGFLCFVSSCDLSSRKILSDSLSILWIIILVSSLSLARTEIQHTHGWKLCLLNGWMVA